MQTVTKNTRTLTEEIAYRTGFTEGARTTLEYIPRFLDRGLPLVDAVEILRRWINRLERWAVEAVNTDPNSDSAPPKP